MKKLFFLSLQFCLSTLLAQNSTATRQQLLDEILSLYANAQSISYQGAYHYKTSAANYEENSQVKACIQHRKDGAISTPQLFSIETFQDDKKIYYLDTLEQFIEEEAQKISYQRLKYDKDNQVRITLGNEYIFPAPLLLTTQYQTTFLQGNRKVTYVDSLHYLKIIFTKENNSTDSTIHIINTKTKRFEIFTQISYFNAIRNEYSFKIEQMQFNKVEKKAIKKYSHFNNKNYTQTKVWEMGPSITPLGTRIPTITGFYYPNYGAQDAAIQYGKLTIVDFWYAACVPCMLSVPKLNKLQDKYGDKIQIFGLNILESDKKYQKKVEKFIQNNQPTYPLVFLKTLPEGLLASCYPTLYVLDENGSILWGMCGFYEEMIDDLQNMIDNYLQKS